jgi:hypothetical protein
MIITTEKDVILGNGAKSTGFTIQANAKVFKILSSDLYSEKIRAVVRELITNMIDAHALNGCTDKFEVHAPGKLDPRFVCRDFGPGMSDFQIRGNDEEPGLYNSYFASSKTESNDFIGGFGLGSKSPFSYTDTFSVTSYHEGEIRGYVVYMDNDGPQIKPTFTKPMAPTDRTGIEVVVPVEEKDFNEFHSEIAYIMRPFVGLADVKGLNREISYFPEFEDFYTVRDRNYTDYEYSGVYAVYGGIVYPIANVLNKNNYWIGIKNDLVYIRFPLGSLDIAPSREALSLDDRTKANILSRIEELDKIAFKEDIEEYKKGKPRHVYRELSGMNYNAREYLKNKATKFTEEQLTFNQLYTRFDVPASLNQPTPAVYNCEMMPRIKRIKNSAESSAVASLHRMFGINAKKINVVIEDTKNRVNIVRGLYDYLGKKKKSAIDIKQGENILFLNPESENQIEMLPTILQLFEDDTVNIFRLTELEATVKDYIPKPERNNEPRPKTPSVYTYTRREDNTWKMEERFIPASEAEDIDGFVVFINRGSYMAMDGETVFGNGSVNAIGKMARLLGLNEFHVIRPTLQKKIRKLDNCTCLFSTIVDETINAIDNVDYNEYIGSNTSANRYLNQINEYSELSFMNKYFSTIEVTEAYTRLANIFSTLQHVYFTYGSELDTNLRLCRHTYNKLQENASSNNDILVNKFRTNFNIISNYMDRRNSLTEFEVQSIVKTMKALEAFTETKE